jgi:hypothetical protein
LDENVIVGMVSVGDYMYVFRTQDICVVEGSSVTGTDLFSVRRAAVNHGAASQAAICVVGENVYHFDGNAVYRFDGIETVPVSLPISSYMPTTQRNTRAAHLSYNPIRRQLVLCLPDIGSQYANVPTPASSYALLMDVDTGAWWVYGGNSHYVFAPNCGLFFQGTTDSTPKYSLLGTNVYQLDDTTTPVTDDTPFAVQTAWDDSGEPQKVKDYERLKIYIQTESSLSAPSTLVSVYTNGSGTAKISNRCIVPSDGCIDVRLDPIQGRNISVGLRVNDAYSLGPVRLTGISYSYATQEDGM